MARIPFMSNAALARSRASASENRPKTDGPLPLINAPMAPPASMMFLAVAAASCTGSTTDSKILYIASDIAAVVLKRLEPAEAHTECMRAYAVTKVKTDIRIQKYVVHHTLYLL